MALVLPCAKCGQRLNIPDELKGKQVRCPKCSLTMRLPESSRTTTFQCPGCSTILKVGSAAATVPTAPVTSRPSLSGSSSRAPAPQAAANPYPPGAGPYVSPSNDGPLSSGANSAYRPPAAAPSYRQPGQRKSLLGPGLLIAIPNGIGVLLTTFLMISILVKGSENSIASTDQTVLTEVRRPGEAIGGTLFFAFTGFSLFAKGAAHFINR